MTHGATCAGWTACTMVTTCLYETVTEEAKFVIRMLEKFMIEHYSSI